MNVRLRHLAVVFVLLALSACSDGAPTPFDAIDPEHAISDGAHGGSQRFFFLPTLVADPGDVGVFDETLSPVVEICEWEVTCVATIATFERVPSGPRVEVGPSYYLVRWYTSDYDVEPGRIYRIHVRLGAEELGFADVVIGADRMHAKSLMTDDVFPLVDGGALGIKFRIVDAPVDDQAPTAVLDAPATVPVGATFILDGSRSVDVGGVVARYVWTLLGTGAPVETADPTIESSLFGVLAPGAHTFQLVVVDDSGNESAPATARVVVLDQERPTAVLAVPDFIPPAGATLDGSSSFDVGGGRIVEWRWTLLETGITIVTSEPTVTTHPFGALPPGTATFQLVVTDDSGNESLPVTAQARTVDNARPTAILDAPATAPSGTLFTLDGSRSTDVGGRVVQWTWTRIESGIPIVTNEPTLSSSVFGLLWPGAHTFQLVVTDDSGNESEPVTARVIVIDQARPTAVLHLPDFIPPAGATLDGSSSFDLGGGRIVELRWTLLETGVTIVTSESTVTTNAFGTLPQGVVRFQLVVVDDSGNESLPVISGSRTADVTAPTAVLDAPATVPFGTSFRLDGSRSTDIGGTVITWIWTWIERGITLETGGPLLQSSSFGSSMVVGPQTFRLVVRDTSGNLSAPVTVLVQVTPL